MFFRIALLLCVGLFVAHTSALPPCVCTRELKPVCASDGQTYSNKCLFQCKRLTNPELTIVKKGDCMSTPLCICSFKYQPVCGSDDNTYPNECTLNCVEDVRLQYEGECKQKPETCICTLELRPVCGTNGKTYDNPCMLNCAREHDEDLHIDHEGACANKE